MPDREIGQVFSGLLAALDRAAAPEDGLRRALGRLVRVSGARAGAISIRPGEHAARVMVAGARCGSALGAWLCARLAEPARGARVAVTRVKLPGQGGAASSRLLRIGLGPPWRPVGELILVGDGARFDRGVIPTGFAEEFGQALERRWQLHRQSRRLRVINGVTALMAGPASLARTYRRAGEDLAGLVPFDALAVLVREAERAQLVSAHVAVPPGQPGVSIDPLPAKPRTLAWLRDARRLSSPADRDAPPALTAWLVEQGFRSAAAVPLVAGGAPFGALVALQRDTYAFAEADVEVLADVARPLASAIEHSRLLDETGRRAEEGQRQARRNEALLQAGRAVSRSLDLGETVDVILQQTREVLGADSCGLFSLDEATGELRSVKSLDVAPSRFGQIRIRVGEGVTGQAVLERRMLQSADLATDPRVRFRQIPGESGLRSMLVAPLLVGDRVLGALTVLRRRAHEFTADEQRMVGALADQAAMAFEHARLFSSEKRLVDVVLDTLPLGLYVLDRALRVVRHNPAAAAALGSPPPPQSLLEVLPAEQSALVGEVLARALDGAPVDSLELELPGPAGPRRFRLTVAPLPAAESPEATHVVLLAEDVTLQRRMQQQMLLTERLTVAGRLAAGVAHELNNPLATIAGCAESLRERSRDAALKAAEAFQDFPGYLAIIEEEAFRCKEITGSLLQLVRDPGGRRSTSDLNALVDRVLDLLRRQARFTHARMRADLDPELPPVVGNEGQLRQVFLGISSNALEATGGQGPLTVRTHRRGLEEVIVEFIDEGPGIPDSVVPHVFEPFFTTKPPGQGTGLGLAIAQSIVAEHGGRIELRTRLDQGTTFRIVLPVAGGVQV